jgi:hypothetical protein
MTNVWLKEPSIGQNTILHTIGLGTEGTGSTIQLTPFDVVIPHNGVDAEVSIKHLGKGTASSKVTGVHRVYSLWPIGIILLLPTNMYVTRGCAEATVAIWHRVGALSVSIEVGVTAQHTSLSRLLLDIVLAELSNRGDVKLIAGGHLLKFPHHSVDVTIELTKMLGRINVELQSHTINLYSTMLYLKRIFLISLDKAMG